MVFEGVRSKEWVVAGLIPASVFLVIGELNSPPTCTALFRPLLLPFVPAFHFRLGLACRSSRPRNGRIAARHECGAGSFREKWKALIKENEQRIPSRSTEQRPFVSIRGGRNGQRWSREARSGTPGRGGQSADCFRPFLIDRRFREFRASRSNRVGNRTSRRNTAARSAIVRGKKRPRRGSDWDGPKESTGGGGEERRRKTERETERMGENERIGEGGRERWKRNGQGK